MIIYAVLLTGLSSCDMPHNGTRQLAIDLTKQIYNKICSVKYGTSLSCGAGKDVRFDADLGTVAYINIYGVTNEAEIDDLVNFAAKFRDERDKHIPVDLTFYSDLDKSHQLKHTKLKGE
jgi:hypothetical protein